DDRPTECKSELIAVKRRLDAAGRFEKSDCIQRCIPVKFPSRSVKLIGARSVRSIDHRSARTPEFGAVGIRLDLEFRDRVRRDLHDLARKTLIAGAICVVIDTVKKEVIDGRTQSIDIKSSLSTASADRAVGAGFANTGSKEGEIRIRSSIER